MAASTTSLALSHTVLEDVLAYLPISVVTEYNKGQVIYDQDHPSKSIYLVLSGKVDVSQVTDKGRKLLLEIVRPDELFGESAFLNIPAHSGQATALEKTKVMRWAISEVEDLVMTRPRLAVALMQVLVQRNVEFARRIESYSTESIDRRLARALIRFCQRLGTTEADGTLRMMPVTHELLSRYVGTSREIITHHMNEFRKRGCVSYSRRGIILYHDAMKATINGHNAN